MLNSCTHTPTVSIKGLTLVLRTIYWTQEGTDCCVVVWRTEAADACQLRRCKYAEVSATLGHGVDELLVGLVKQIRLRTNSHRSSTTSDSTRSLWSTAGRLRDATKFFVRGLLGRPPSSCSDLMKPWTRTLQTAHQNDIPKTESLFCVFFFVGYRRQ